MLTHRSDGYPDLLAALRVSLPDPDLVLGAVLPWGRLRAWSAMGRSPFCCSGSRRSACGAHGASDKRSDVGPLTSNRAADPAPWLHLGFHRRHLCTGRDDAGGRCLLDYITRASSARNVTPRAPAADPASVDSAAPRSIRADGMALAPIDLTGKRLLITGPTGQVALPVVAAYAKSAEVFALGPLHARGGRGAGARPRCGADQGRPRRACELAPGPGRHRLRAEFRRRQERPMGGGSAGERRGHRRPHDAVAARQGRRPLLLGCRCTPTAGDAPRREDAALGDNHRSMFPTYSISKIAAETVVRLCARRLGVPATIARLSVPYGDNGGWPFYHLIMMRQGVPITVHPERPNRCTTSSTSTTTWRRFPRLLAAASVDTTTVNFGGSGVHQHRGVVRLSRRADRPRADLSGRSGGVRQPLPRHGAHARVDRPDARRLARRHLAHGAPPGAPDALAPEHRGWAARARCGTVGRVPARRETLLRQRLHHRDDLAGNHVTRHLCKREVTRHKR